MVSTVHVDDGKRNTFICEHNRMLSVMARLDRDQIAAEYDKLISDLWRDLGQPDQQPQRLSDDDLVPAHIAKPMAPPSDFTQPDTAPAISATD